MDYIIGFALVSPMLLALIITLYSRSIQKRAMFSQIRKCIVSFDKWADVRIVMQNDSITKADILESEESRGEFEKIPIYADATSVIISKRIKYEV